jgi:hypothetical protein
MAIVFDKGFRRPGQIPVKGRLGMIDNMARKFLDPRTQMLFQKRLLV